MDFKGWIAEVGSTTLSDILESFQPNDKIGAYTTFSGVVRNISDVESKPVVEIEIETWEERGDDSMNAIAERIGRKFNLIGVRIVHLVGKIQLGQPIVFVALASIHRREAFDALEEIIHAYKNESPVWKKEIYLDGTSRWITTAKSK